MAAKIKRIIEDDATIHFYLGDLHHNPDGPAVIGFAGRHKEYWFKGLRHRIEGPANVFGVIEYWIDDPQYLSEGEYLMKLFTMGYVNRKMLILDKCQSALSICSCQNSRALVSLLKDSSTFIPPIG